jgi:hypothetical protein
MPATPCKKSKKTVSKKSKKEIEEEEEIIEIVEETKETILINKTKEFLSALVSRLPHKNPSENTVLQIFKGCVNGLDNDEPVKILIESNLEEYFDYFLNLFDNKNKDIVNVDNKKSKKKNVSNDINKLLDLFPTKKVSILLGDDTNIINRNTKLIVHQLASLEKLSFDLLLINLRSSSDVTIATNIVYLYTQSLPNYKINNEKKFNEFTNKHYDDKLRELLFMRMIFSSQGWSSPEASGCILGYCAASIMNTKGVITLSNMNEHSERIKSCLSVLKNFDLSFFYYSLGYSAYWYYNNNNDNCNNSNDMCQQSALLMDVFSFFLRSLHFDNNNNEFGNNGSIAKLSICFLLCYQWANDVIVSISDTSNENKQSIINSCTNLQTILISYLVVSTNGADAYLLWTDSIIPLMERANETHYEVHQKGTKSDIKNMKEMANWFEKTNNNHNFLYNKAACCVLVGLIIQVPNKEDYIDNTVDDGVHMTNEIEEILNVIEEEEEMTCGFSLDNRSDNSILATLDKEDSKKSKSTKQEVETIEDKDIEIEIDVKKNRKQIPVKDVKVTKTPSKSAKKITIESSKKEIIESDYESDVSVASRTRGSKRKSLDPIVELTAAQIVKTPSKTPSKKTKNSTIKSTKKI